jgi:hypothetical protein
MKKHYNVNFTLYSCLGYLKETRYVLNIIYFVFNNNSIHAQMIAKFHIKRNGHDSLDWKNKKI